MSHNFGGPRPVEADAGRYLASLLRECGEIARHQPLLPTWRALRILGGSRRHLEAALAGGRIPPCRVAEVSRTIARGRLKREPETPRRSQRTARRRLRGVRGGRLWLHRSGLLAFERDENIPGPALRLERSGPPFLQVWCVVAGCRTTGQRSRQAHWREDRVTALSTCLPASSTGRQVESLIADDRQHHGRW